jgi:hypothetical protein
MTTDQDTEALTLELRGGAPLDGPNTAHSLREELITAILNGALPGHPTSYEVTEGPFVIVRGFDPAQMQDGSRWSTPVVVETIEILGDLVGRRVSVHFEAAETGQIAS